MSTVEDPPLYPFANPTALEPPPEWQRLRDTCPVARVRMASGDHTMLLTRYDDVRAMLMDPRFTRQLDAEDAAALSSNGDASAFGARNSTDAEEAATMIGAGHQRWRRLVGRAFTAKRVLALQPRIQQIADELIDAMTAAGSPADLGTALGFPLPVRVICELLGVPQQDQHRFAEWSDTMLNLTRYTQEQIAASGRDFYAYMADLAKQKRTNPGEDLLSALGATVGDERGMTERELVGTGQGLLIAGHETTANMIGKMVAMLLSRRDRWQRVVAEPELVPAAVEEALRYDANPGFGMPRYLSEEVEIAGTTLPAGTTVVCSMAAANRDERAFGNAADMDVTRTPNPHLSFGVGPYSCVGQALARVELRTVLSTLVTRLPTLELAVAPEELTRREGLLVGGIESVPVRW
jgi:cytochrome P450